ncbi:hypothetical protein J1614_012227 [Plenodomus biglobosus]|nr:hypothetical protein J1614_012227 [Plenodomus biglobosus]
MPISICLGELSLFKLSDFQGIYTDPDGTIWNGQALENVKAYLPRSPSHSDESSDLFALGSAIYEIMVGHEPFPELNELDDESKIEERYRNKRFPSVDSVVGGNIISQCWSLVYDQVNVCIKDLKMVENSLIP